MARIRTIKPEFWTDEKVVAMTPLARLLFIGMWNFVDDEGRGEYSPSRLKMQILPADAADSSMLLGEIRREGLIVVYTVDDKEYFQVRNFSKHQKVDKRTPSKYPPPPNSAELPRVVPTEGNGRDQGKELEEEDSSAPQRSTTPAPRREVDFDELEAKCLEAAGLERASHFEVISAVLVGEDALESIVLPALRAMRSDGKQGRSWKYYLPAIEERRKAVGSAPAGLTVSTSPSSPAEPRVFIAVGTPEWAEWRKVNPRARAFRSEVHKADGYYFPSQWPTEHQVSAA